MPYTLFIEDSFLCENMGFKIPIQVAPKPSRRCVVKFDYIRNLLLTTNFYTSDMQVPGTISIINSLAVDLVSTNEFCRGIVRKNQTTGVIRIASRLVFTETQALPLASRFKYIAKYADSIESATQKAK